MNDMPRPESQQTPSESTPMTVNSLCRLGSVISLCIAIQMLMVFFLNPWVTLSIAALALGVVFLLAATSTVTQDTESQNMNLVPAPTEPLSGEERLT